VEIRDRFAAWKAETEDLGPRGCQLVTPRLADFSAEEVAVLHRIGDGITVDGLARALGSAFERVRGAMFSLVSRRLLVLSAAEAVAPSRWQAALSAAERSLAAEGIAIPAPTPAGPQGAVGRTAAAQALYDEGIGHLTAGRIEVAVARLRDAKQLAPHDPLITGALQRLAPWAS
jgi:hypothetical protein